MGCACVLSRFTEVDGTGVVVSLCCTDANLYKIIFGNPFFVFDVMCFGIDQVSGRVDVLDKKRVTVY